jgi:hypothetical protein
LYGASINGMFRTKATRWTFLVSSGSRHKKTEMIWFSTLFGTIIRCKILICLGRSTNQCSRTKICSSFSSPSTTLSWLSSTQRWCLTTRMLRLAVLRRFSLGIRNTQVPSTDSLWTWKWLAKSGHTTSHWDPSSLLWSFCRKLLGKKSSNWDKAWTWWVSPT